MKKPFGSEGLCVVDIQMDMHQHRAFVDGIIQHAHIIMPELMRPEVCGWMRCFMSAYWVKRKSPPGIPEGFSIPVIGCSGH